MREGFVSLFKRSQLKENNLHFYSYFDLVRMLEKISPDGGIKIIPETGQSQSVHKKAIRRIMDIFGIPYKTLLPHILVLIKKAD